MSTAMTETTTARFDMETMREKMLIIHAITNIQHPAPPEVVRLAGRLADELDGYMATTTHVPELPHGTIGLLNALTALAALLDIPEADRTHGDNVSDDSIGYTAADLADLLYEMLKEPDHAITKLIQRSQQDE